jgi:hypothetical protein
VSALGAFTGVLGGVAGGDPLGGIASGAADTVAGIGAGWISSFVLGGTKAALQEVASLIGAATTPNLQSTWFSSTYWRVAALAAMLTVPFLCAAAVQALARSDLALLAKAVFGYLPLALLGVSLAAPLTMLLLAATDQMSVAVAATAADSGAQFLDKAALVAGDASAIQGSAFFAVAIGLFAVMAALMLAVELLVRAAAVYVVVLMLPLAFAALVWPARRILAARLVELLVSLILSKFVIVAVLSLAGAAFQGGQPGISALLTAMALLLLATFAPWTLMRILPFTELAAGAAGMLRQELPHSRDQALSLATRSAGAAGLAMELPSRMRSQARQTEAGLGGSSDGPAAGSSPPEFDDPGGSQFAESGGTQSTDPGGTQSTESAVPLSAVTTEPQSGDPRGPGPASESAQPEAAWTASASSAASERPPYVPPELWQREQPLRLDAELLSGPFGHPQPTDPGDSE